MRHVLTLMAAALGLAACGSDGGPTRADDGRPSVAVSNSVLGDVVRSVAGEAVRVEVVIPPGVDPHDFAPSARQAEAVAVADLVVIVGAGFDDAVGDVVEGSEAPTFAVTDHVDLLGDDPHVWLDPTRVATAVDALADDLATLDGVDGAAVRARADVYRAELEELDAELDAELAGVPDGARTLVTNHEVLGYFADRYDFEVVGAVVPSLTTHAEPSPADVAELAALIAESGVRAIFVDATSSTDLAEALGDDVGGVAVVELPTEGLGEPGSGAETYPAMMRTIAERITGALGDP